MIRIRAIFNIRKDPPESRHSPVSPCRLCNSVTGFADSLLLSQPCDVR